MSAGDRILDGLREAVHHEENCPKRAGSYTCECGVVVHAPYRPVELAPNTCRGDDSSLRSDATENHGDDLC